MQGKKLTLDTWYQHVDHLQSGVKHSKWCGICLLKANAKKDHREPAVQNDIAFHNAEMAKAAGAK